MPGDVVVQPVAEGLRRVLRPVTRSAPSSGLGVTAIVMFSLAALLLVPQTSGWSLLHAHKEDGEIFLADALNRGPATLFDTYSGYLHLGPRLVAEVASALPLEYATILIGVLTAAVRGVVGVLATHAVAPYAPSLAWARVAGAIVVAAPVGMQESLGNLTNLRWFLVTGAVLAVWGVFDRWGWALAAALVAGLAAMSDPLAILVVPAALLRLGSLRPGWRMLPSATLLMSVLLHAAWLQPGAREPNLGGWFRSPVAHGQQLWVRAVTEAQFGQSGSEVLILVGTVWLAVAAGALVPVLCILAARVSSDPGAVTFAVSLLVMSLLLVAATLTFADLAALDLAEWFSVGQASRYAVIPSALGGAALVLLTARLWTGGSRPLRLIGGASLALLALAVAADLPGDAHNSSGPRWAASLATARVSCVGEPNAREVVIRLTPDTVPRRWEMRTTCGAVREG